MDKKTPKIEINFSCAACKEKFKAEPTRTEEAVDRPWHPFEYFADCLKCGEESPQVGWEKAIFKANTMATGPRTEEGRAKSAANLKGHPTAQEAQITRLNAMKHGLFAKTSKFFPAKPGRYPQCADCEYFEDEVCKEHKACLKRAEVMLRFQVAFENKEPEHLMDMFSETHAAMHTMIDWMIMTIAADGGPQLKSPTWYYDKDGTFHLARWKDDNNTEHQLFDHEAHPLLKPLIEYVNKLSMSLSDLGMTPKVQDENDIMKGFIDQDSKNKDSEQDYQQRLEANSNKLLELIQSSHVAHPVKTINSENERQPIEIEQSLGEQS